MVILVIGDEENLNECRLKFGPGHQYFHESGSRPDIVFDFLKDKNPKRLAEYSSLKTAVFFDTCATDLAHVLASLRPPFPSWQFGFAGLPTFVNRELLEVSFREPGQKETLVALCAGLGTAFEVVEDRVGLVTPRVICMIINEAYFTVQDGTASREDIDLAMKLGTHYPLGPFEWCRKIGVKNVCKVLEAVYRDTHDERYALCPLLIEENHQS